MVGTDGETPPSDAAAFALTWANVAAKSKFKGGLDSCCAEDADDALAVHCDEDDCSAFISFNLVW